MRKTKIICTLGPASDSEKALSELLDAGMNVARLNFSHGTHEEHQVKIDRIKKVRAEKKMPLAIMLDTKGPEYRIGLFKEHKVSITAGSEFIFTIDDVVGDEHKVSVSYKNLNKELSKGDRILVNNGLLEFTVKEIKGNDIICNIDEGGFISDRKSMSFPGKVLKQVFLSEQDKSDLLFGIKNNVEFVACSFVSTKRDILDIVEFLKDNGGESIGVIAKIENQSGIDNVKDIISVCDGIMIGRGDMGVEVSFDELPAIQKKLISSCIAAGKIVITATEMLESMINNPRPTRAETTDVANAIYDGTTAIMLSGETAVGKYPVLTVETMSKIAETTEKSIDYVMRYINTEYEIENELDAISHSVSGIAMDIGANSIVVSSISGKTARMVSGFRSTADILALSVDEKTYNKLSLAWGVKPAMCKMYSSVEELFEAAKPIAIQELNLKKGDKMIITGGTSQKSGGTNVLLIEKV